jgi:hypothetical protein
MSNPKQIQYEPVDASPVKSFFVYMLTRDIKLEEAILDLLDNCVDGILRSKKSDNKNKPYAGYRAEIKFDKDSFSISDNCGGIPWSLHDYAFRMGRAVDRPPDARGTVGVYGIGMKRAIFKMGMRSLISTQNADHGYEVEITPEWIADEVEWHIPVRPATKSTPVDGTTIVVGDLHLGVKKRFGEDAESFESGLEHLVATHYAFIIDKGLEVKLNRRTVRARPTKLVFNRKVRGAKREGIQPFMFKTETDGVEVFLAVGFTRPIPSQDEIEREQEEKKYSSLDAGWTVLCNDRAVLYCDRSELTGWGEAGIPRYHTQFIAISGIVEFRADDPSKLPTTTTKRGIDASSALYLQVKNKMREGMRIFTDYTNKWKARAEESRKQIEAAGPGLSFQEIKAEAERLPFTSTKHSIPKGEQYKPELPLPKRPEPQTRRITFVKQVEEVKIVAEHLFEDPDVDPSMVGERCFDLILSEARR